MQLAQNNGTEALEAGAVVVFKGIGAPAIDSGAPVVQVAKSSSANSSAVAGVVFSRYDISNMTQHMNTSGEGFQGSSAEITLAEAIAPGEYLLVVVLGPAQVKASALGGAIQPGDLLASGEQSGYASKVIMVDVSGVKFAAPGVTFAKALEALDSGEELIYVDVTLK